MNIEDKAYFGKELTSANIGDTVSIATEITGSPFKSSESFKGQVKITSVQGSYCTGRVLTGNKKGYLINFMQGEIVD